jgi:hypothetical protein
LRRRIRRKPLSKPASFTRSFAPTAGRKPCGGAEPNDVPEKKANGTIGEYVDAVRSKCAVYPKTVESYAAALRKIAADIHGLADSGEKKSPVHREAWREKINSIKLQSLTAEKIESWRVEIHQA